MPTIHRMLPLIPMLRTAIDRSMPAEKPVHARNAMEAAFRIFVNANPSRMRNGTARTLIRYQIYSSATMDAD